ncbi:MAG: Maf family protein [Clostridia bacterium]|nr:Maf family protein [Clostridia bacterium]
MKYILASMSPRRKEILGDMGLTFTVEPADIDENIGVTEPDLLVRELSLLKAAHISGKYCGKDFLVIAADTVVALDGEILGKPADKNDAKRMLEMLSGKTHSVFTGYCVSDTKTGKTVSKCAETKVTFKSLSEEEIDKYIAGGSPMDKAGAYGIQDEGGNFVSGIDGEFSNVVGLPKEALKTLLKEEFTFEGR